MYIWKCNRYASTSSKSLVRIAIGSSSLSQEQKSVSVYRVRGRSACIRLKGNLVGVTCFRGSGLDSPWRRSARSKCPPMLYIMQCRPYCTTSRDRWCNIHVLHCILVCLHWRLSLGSLLAQRTHFFPSRCIVAVKYQLPRLKVNAGEITFVLPMSTKLCFLAFFDTKPWNY